MFKLLFSLSDKIVNNFKIFQNIIRLRRIKPTYLFFSENKNYQKYSYLIIETLVKKYPNEVYYVSSDIDDKINNPDVKNIFIGKSLLMIIFFLIIRAKYMFLTLTDLNIHIVKKTNNVEKYIYYFHAPVSTTKAYTATAFDNYDVILCNGDYHLDEIRKRESIKKIKKKKLIKTGYFYFDYINNRMNIQTKANEILIAPSWNYNQKNFVNENLEEIIQSVLNKGYIVKFRPHPESFKRSMLTINSFKKKFSNQKFILDETTENINSMQNAKCLITDSSGIAIEFILLFKRPVLYFEGNDKIHNVEFNKYNDLVTMDQKVKDSFGFTFKKENIKDLDVLINKSTTEFVNKDDQIKDFIVNNFYNYGDTVDNFNDLITKDFLNNIN
tara:strand:+ start:6687 stop:7838 length:1152 start_codon:yes stop_codon:yes gene_type:complete